jgi:transposase
MRGPGPLYPIHLEEPALTSLRKLVRSTTAPIAQVLRAKIILMAHDQPHFNNQQIADEIGCALSTVRKWRKRYTQTGQIKDAPRPGAPRRFSP